MDAFSTLLQIHIIGATVLAASLVTTAVTLYRATTKIALYKSQMVFLAVTAVVEIITGSAMYLVAADGDLVAFCGKMGIYLGLTAIAEYALWNKLRALATSPTE